MRGNLGLAGLVPPGCAPPRWSGVPTPVAGVQLGAGAGAQKQVLAGTVGGAACPCADKRSRGTCRWSQSWMVARPNAEGREGAARSNGRWGARGEREKEREPPGVRAAPPVCPPSPPASWTRCAVRALGRGRARRPAGCRRVVVAHRGRGGRRMAPRCVCGRVAGARSGRGGCSSHEAWRRGGGATWPRAAAVTACRRHGGGTPSQPLRVVRRARCGRAPRRGHPHGGVVATRQPPAWRCRAVGTASAEARCGASPSLGATAASSPPPPTGEECPCGSEGKSLTAT